MKKFFVLSLASMILSLSAFAANEGPITNPNCTEVIEAMQAAKAAAAVPAATPEPSATTPESIPVQ